jgi:hypothetical protein
VTTTDSIETKPADTPGARKPGPKPWDAENIVVWIEPDQKRIFLAPFEVDPPLRCSDGSTTPLWGTPREHGITGHWVDPIGAAYTAWNTMRDDQRVLLMLETAIDLVMQGFDLGAVLRAFAEVKQFRALGEASYPMCRALTTALIGQCLEPNTMGFEDLLVRYGCAGRIAEGLNGTLVGVVNGQRQRHVKVVNDRCEGGRGRRQACTRGFFDSTANYACAMRVS